MHIDTIRLHQFRGAKKLTLKLDPQLNVFVGMNGSGKSTVLDASAILLSWMVNRMKSAKGSGRPINKPDIQNGRPLSKLAIECKQFAGQDPVRWGIVKSHYRVNNSEERTELKALNTWVHELQKTITGAEFKVNLPLFAYYPVNRAVLDIPLRIRGKHQFDLFSAYDGSLTGGANFRTFFEWFRDREDLENENLKLINGLLPTPQDCEHPDSQLEAVRTAITQFMPDFSDLTVRRSPLRMEIKKKGQVLTVDQLSDGEKCLMALVGDIARRLSICNAKSNTPLKGRGVIMIDEIDMHLHPKWQGMVVPKLTEVFPNCQFLISTHSPHVLTRVQPENIRLMEIDGEEMRAHKVSESYGKTANRILEDLMGLESTRPAEIEERLDELYDMIESGDLKKALDEIDDLRTEIGSDPELTKAAVLIKRKRSWANEAYNEASRATGIH